MNHSLENGGSRECRVHAAPAVSCAMYAKKCAHEHTGTAGALRHSLRNGLTAYAALSPETNSSCLRRCRLDGGPIRLDRCRHRQLGTSHGCRDHTVLPYAATSVILRAIVHSRPKPPCEQFLAPDAAASTASRPAFVTTRDPPLLPGRDGAERATDLGVRESDIFFRGGLDVPNQPENVQQIAVCAQRYWEPFECWEDEDARRDSTLVKGVCVRVFQMTFRKPSRSPASLQFFRADHCRVAGVRCQS
jgi:hypothetical protein